MAGTYRRKYGIDFFPANISDVQIELSCWKKWREPEYKAGQHGDPVDNFFRATSQILTREQFIVSRWTEENVLDWTMNDFIICWGCASSEKSNTYGLMTYLDWSVDPLETFAILGSTTKDALKDRSFEAVVRYFKILKKQGFPGKLNKTATSVLLDDDQDDEASDKASIKGLAVKEGTEEESRANLRGRHLPYARLIGDELSQMRMSFITARTNLRIGSRNFKFAATTNIDGFEDLAGQFSVPIGGWSTVNPDVEFWRTQWGVVRRHDGIRSPALVEPGGKEKYPHLLNQDTLDEILKEEGGNMDAPQIWVMVRAWPPPAGREETVINSAESLAWKMRDPCVWEDNFTKIASLDPAFNGGDAAVLTFGEVGMTREGRMVIKGAEKYDVPILASSPRPIVGQISDFVRERLKFHNVPLSLLACDDSGTQSVADAIEMEEKESGILRISYGGSPSDLPVSAFNEKLCSARYGNKVTEMYYTAREFAQYDQIRNVPEKALSQITRRRLKRRLPTLLLEEKKDFKKNTGQKSPDDADSFVGLVELARTRLGVIPGGTRFQPAGPAAAPQFFSEELLRHFDVDAQ